MKYVIIFIFFFTIGSLIRHDIESTYRVQKKIIAIGGCGKEGYCGVQYEDGTFGNSHYPVIGMTVNVEVKK